MYYRKLVEVRISGLSPKILIQQPKVDFRNLHLTNSQVICMQVICGPHLEEHHLAVAQSLNCVRLCEPMDCSTSGFPVFHSLSEFAQTHIHWVSDAAQPSHPLLLPSSLAFNLSQHQVFSNSQFFTSGGQSVWASASASVLPVNIQGWFPLGLTVWSPCSPRELSRVFCNTKIQRHQFFSFQPSLPYIPFKGGIKLTKFRFLVIFTRTWRTVFIFIWNKFPTKLRNIWVMAIISISSEAALSTEVVI